MSIPLFFFFVQKFNKRSDESNECPETAATRCAAPLLEGYTERDERCVATLWSRALPVSQGPWNWTTLFLSNHSSPC